jgi:hypothetical protein
MAKVADTHETCERCGNGSFECDQCQHDGYSFPLPESHPVSHDECDERIEGMQQEIDDLEIKGESYDDLYTGVEAIVQRLTQEHIFAHRKDAVMWCQEPACSVLRALVNVL